MPSFNNYTFTNIQYTVPEGDNVSVAHPSAVITIVPNDGYTASAADFSIDPSFSDNAVLNVSFTQAGLNVLCTVTFDTGFVMPSSNYTIPLCVTGQADIVNVNIGGLLTAVVGNNITGDSSETNTPYSNSGGFGELETLFNRSYTADSGYYWYTSETPSLNITVGNQSSYNVIQTGTFDSSNRLTGISFEVKYLYPSQDVFNDKINIEVPNVAEIPQPQPIEVTGYSQLPLHVGQSGETVAWTIYGEPTAEYSASMTDGTTTVVIGTNETINSGGTSTVFIDFPDVGNNNVCWTITLTGDLASPFNQPNPVQVCQEPDITVRLTPYATPNIQNYISWTPANYSSYYTPYTEEAGYQYMSFRVTAPLIGARPVETGDVEEFNYNASCVVDGSVTNASSIDISSLTENEGTLAIGDRFNINEGSGYAPFAYEVTAINSATNISVSPNITASNDDYIVFYRNNGNIISVDNSEVIQVSDNSVDLNFNLNVNRSGDEDTTFQINLAQIISYDPT